ncbi:hypothetical protein RKD55_004618 [Rossellomorea marisflavi]
MPIFELGWSWREWLVLGVIALACMGIASVQLSYGREKSKADAKKRELLEADKMAEMGQRVNLIAEKLDIDSSEVIVLPTDNGLFNAETSEGKYLVEFSDTYEEINKIIKLER